MQEQLIDFKTAVLAKEKGFNIPSLLKYASNGKLCDAVFNFDNWYEAPTQSLLQKFIREEYNIDITVIVDWIKGQRVYYVSLSYINSKNEMDIWFSKDSKGYKIQYNTYEEALEEGLYQALLLIETKK